MAHEALPAKMAAESPFLASLHAQVVPDYYRVASKVCFSACPARGGDSYASQGFSESSRAESTASKADTDLNPDSLAAPHPSLFGGWAKQKRRWSSDSTCLVLALMHTSGTRRTSSTRVPVARAVARHSAAARQNTKRPKLLKASNNSTQALTGRGLAYTTRQLKKNIMSATVPLPENGDAVSV